jgi:hypothetical protein
MVAVCRLALSSSCRVSRSRPARSSRHPSPVLRSSLVLLCLLRRPCSLRSSHCEGRCACGRLRLRLLWLLRLSALPLLALGHCCSPDSRGRRCGPLSTGTGTGPVRRSTASARSSRLAWAFRPDPAVRVAGKCECGRRCARGESDTEDTAATGLVGPHPRPAICGPADGITGLSSVLRHALILAPLLGGAVSNFVAGAGLHDACIPRSFGREDRGSARNGGVCGMRCTACACPQEIVMRCRN